MVSDLNPGEMRQGLRCYPFMISLVDVMEVVEFLMIYM